MQNYLKLYPNLVSARKAVCTQAELAEQLGISQQEVSRYERGETKAPVSYLADVAEICSVSVDYLLGRAERTVSQLTPEEADLLRIYNRLNAANRIRLTERARTLLDLQK